MSAADITASGLPSSLAAARRYSEQCLARARGALTAQAHRLDALETVVLAGSLGRLEAHPGSDLDAVLVARAAAPAAEVSAAVESVYDALAQLGLKLPKADGIYRSAASVAELLCESARGSLDEAPATFGRRMQFLLDARAVYRPRAAARLAARIVDWYGGPFLDHDPRRPWTALQNDVERYLHAYAGWQQFRFDASADDGWALRQAKLRGSRLVTFAGLLVLLGESSARADKRAWLVAHLPLTPLERLARVMGRYAPAALPRLLADYEIIHRALADPAQRAALARQRPVPGSLAGMVPAEQPQHAAQARLARTLTRFLLARVDDWDPRFFERLLL